MRAFLETLGEPGADGATKVVRSVETEAPAVQPRSAAPATRRAANRLRARRRTAPVPKRRGPPRGALDIDQEPVQEVPASLPRPGAAERTSIVVKMWRMFPL